MINNNSEASSSAPSSGSQYHQYDCMALACGESGSLNIISELNGLYEDRVRNIESRTSQSTNDPLVHTLKSWVTDLNVQNTELVRALEVLERETACHVKLIEEKLKGTSIATRGYMVKAQDYNNQLQSVPSKSGQAAEDIARIDHLKSDIRNLCRLIQQGRGSDNWNADDYIFFEVTLEDIFGTYPFNSKLTKPNETTSENQTKDTTDEDCGCDTLRLDLEERNKAYEALQAELKKLSDEMLCKDAQLKKMTLELSEFNRKKESIDGELTDRNSLIGSLENDLKTMKEHMALKDEQIMSLIQKIQELREDLQEKSCTVNTLLQKASEVSQTQTVKEQRKIEDQQNEILILSRQLQETEYRLDYVIGDKQQVTDNLNSMHRELQIKKQEVAALTNVITDMDKCAKDKQAALTGEIADKHDEISQLKRECLQLEDRCRQADVQIIFKDGIIKEMRKELKLGKLKVMSYGESRPKSNSQIPESLSSEDFGQNVATDEMKDEMNRLITILKSRDEKIALQEMLIEELQKDLVIKQKSLPGTSMVNRTNGEEISASGEPNKSPAFTEVLRSQVGFSKGDAGDLPRSNANDCYKGLENSMQQVERMTRTLEAREEEICQKDAMIVRLRSLLRLAHSGLRKASKASPRNCTVGCRVGNLCKTASHKKLPKEDTKPPKILRAASIEEFRVKTVEAQAAIEDMMEEMETLLSNLNERESKFNELERIIGTLQQNLYRNRQEMSELEDTSNCDREKQGATISLEGKAMQILQLKEALNKSFRSLSLSPQQTQVDHYQTAANEFQLAMDKITCELMDIMHAVLSREKQVVFKQDVIRDVKESLVQIQSSMGQVQAELVSYLKVKEKTEQSRKESERKMEKWQTELENAQDELRDNVEQYAATEYASRRLVQMANKERPPSRSPLIRNHVYRGTDNEVRRTIEEFKEQIDILVDELEEFDDYKDANEQKVKELQESLERIQRQVDLQQSACSGLSADQGCNCAEEDDPVEILQTTLQMTDCELEQIQQDIENLLSEGLDDGNSPAKNLLAIIGEHTAIVEELNDRSKDLQNALNKARAQIRTVSERNGDRKSANQLPSSKEEQIVLDEFCKKTLKLEEELERSRAQVQSIKGELKSNEAQLESQNQNCQCSDNSQIDSVNPQNNQLFEGDSCSSRPFKQPGEASTNVQVAELERQVTHQQVTIGNLQRALLSTKHQLEDLQGRGSHEVLRQEFIVERLRDENLELEAENVNLFVDVAQLEGSIKQKAGELRFKEESLGALKSIVEKLRMDLDHMMMENGSLYEELQQKDEILRKMAKVNHERTILQRELQEELSNTTTLVKMQQHMQIIHQTTRNFQTNVTNKVKAICMKSQNSPKGVCRCNSRSGGGSEDETVRQLENQIMDVEMQLADEERLNDEYAEKIGALQLAVDSQAVEIKNWKLSMNKLQKSYDKAEQCAQEKEDAIKLLKLEICELQRSSNACQCFSLRSKLQQREQQVISLHLEVDDLKHKSNSCKCTELKAQVHQKDSELDGLSHQISELRAKVSECNCRSLSCQLKSKETELSRQRREIAELRQRLAACRCASKNKAIEQDAIIKAMEVSVNTMENIIRQKDEQFVAAQNQYYEEKSDMEKRLSELMNIAEEVKSSCSCNKNKAAVVEAAEREALLQAKFTEHDRQLRAKMQEMHSMELQLSDEIQALNAQVLNLELELRQERCQVERLQVESRNKNIELEDGREQILKLYGALSKAKSCLIEANDRLERSDAEIDHLGALLSSYQDEKDGCADDKLTSMVREMSNLKCEITRLVQLREKTNTEGDDEDDDEPNLAQKGGGETRRRHEPTPVEKHQGNQRLNVPSKGRVNSRIPPLIHAVKRLITKEVKLLYSLQPLQPLCQTELIMSMVVTQPIPDSVQCCLTSVISREQVASLQEAYQYLIYEFNSKSQSVVKLRSILSKVSFSDSQGTMILCSMQRGDCTPQIQDVVAKKDLNPHIEIKKLCRTKELMTNAINKLISDNTNLRRKLRARTLSQNNNWPLLSYPAKVLEIQRESKISSSSISGQSSNKDESDASTSTEENNQQDEEISYQSSYESYEYAEISETSSQSEKN